MSIDNTSSIRNDGHIDESPTSPPALCDIMNLQPIKTEYLEPFVSPLEIRENGNDNSAVPEMICPICKTCGPSAQFFGRFCSSKCVKESQIRKTNSARPNSFGIQHTPVSTVLQSDAPNGSFEVNGVEASSSEVPVPPPRKNLSDPPRPSYTVPALNKCLECGAPTKSKCCSRSCGGIYASRYRRALCNICQNYPCVCQKVPKKSHCVVCKCNGDFVGNLCGPVCAAKKLSSISSFTEVSKSNGKSKSQKRSLHGKLTKSKKTKLNKDKETMQENGEVTQNPEDVEVSTPVENNNDAPSFDFEPEETPAEPNSIETGINPSSPNRSFAAQHNHDSANIPDVSEAGNESEAKNESANTTDHDKTPQITSISGSNAGFNVLTLPEGTEIYRLACAEYNSRISLNKVQKNLVKFQLKKAKFEFKIMKENYQREKHERKKRKRKRRAKLEKNPFDSSPTVIVDDSDS